MQIVCLLWGIISIFFMFVGVIPLLGALNWISIPMAFIGLVMSYMVNKNTAPGTGSLSKWGMILCGIAIVVGILRLKLGMGVI
jgi:hypothetical protein